MAKTPLTGSAYATAADMVARYDVRTLGDLLSDNEQVRLTPSQVAASTILATLLSEASGEVEGVAFGRRVYEPADFAALTDNALAKLAGIVCAITLQKLMARRPSRVKELPTQAALALEEFEKLRNGDRIFAFAETADAGKDMVTITNDSMVPCPISKRALRFFGDLSVPGCGEPERDR